MKKFYSFVLMAAALLIGTNAWANYEAGWLQAQFDAVEADGQTHTIEMEDDIVLTDPVYLGTATVDEARKSIILEMNGNSITMDASAWVSAKGNKFCSVFNITHGELVIKNSKKSTTTSLIQFTGTGYGKYNDIFNITGSYKSSRWVKNGSVYEINESAAKNTRDADGGWFTHLEIGEGVKLYAPNTVFGAGISIDGYYTNFHGQVSPDATTKSVFGTTSLTGSAGNISLYNRADAPLYNTAIMSAASNGKADGFGYGIRVDVYGDIEFASDATNASGGKSYGIKLNGGLRSTLKTGDYFHPDYCKNMDEAYIATYGATSVSQTNLQIDSVGTYREYYFNHRGDTVDAPFLYIGKNARIIAAAELNEATAIYCSGYGKTLIEGACSGNSGVNVKSGTVELHDAIITCTANSTSVYAAENGNNATGTGAVVVNSVDGRAGGIEVIISGDSKVSTDYGYAIAETVTANNDGTKVTSVVIEGGTIQGGAATGTTGGGAILVSETTKNNENAEVVIYGANLTGNNEVEVGGGTLTDLLPKNEQTQNPEGHVTPVVDPVTGKTTLVIGAGDAPDDANTWADVLDAGEGANVNWEGLEDVCLGCVVADTTLILGELQINSGTGTEAGERQQLTIMGGATLEVKRLVMNAYARIIVKAGGKLIVSGEQGINAPVVENILIEASESAQGIFLFNPKVNSNRHPSATVQMVSKSFYEAPKEVHQRFGMPVYDGNVTLTPVNPGSVITGIKTWDYAADDWSDWTNISAGVTYTDAEPFRGYMLASNNAKNAPMTYEFVGSLVGNENANIMFRYGWNNLANSYVAPINIVEFSKTVAATVGTDILATIYVYKDLGDDTYTWQPINQGNAGTSKPVGYDEVNQQIIYETIPTEIQPLQAFLMQLRTEGTANQAVDYEKNVYNPAMNIANAAPARNRQINNEMNVSIYNAEGFDDITLIENGLFSNDLDNGFDAAKYMNNSNLKIYAMNAEEPMSIFATDNVEGTFMGIDAQKAGEYTMLISGVKGMEYAIIDMTTGVATLAEEGAKYNFFTEAGRHDYRFEIVSAAKMPTAIENTEVVKSTKGIYTITGQYLGENFEVLPKGMYIVNGVKVIK